MIKVALVSPAIEGNDSPLGGVAAVTHALAKHLVQLGLEVHVVQVGAVPGTRASSTLGVLHGISQWPIPGAMRFWSSDRWQLSRIVRAIDPQLVHVHGAASWADATAKFVPTVLTIHGAVEKEILIRRPVLGRVVSFAVETIEKRAFENIQNVIRINPYVNELRKFNRRQRVFDIPNPISEVFFEGQLAGRRGIMCQVAWVGSGARRKNLLGALRILRELVRLNGSTRMVVAGVSDSDSSDHISECREYISKHRLWPVVRFAGRLDRRGIREILDDSEALLMTSIQETAPCVISEALSRGCYVVGPRAFGVPYMLSSEAHGITFDLLDDPYSVARTFVLGVAEYADARQARIAESWKYHPATVAASTLKAYETILA